MKLSRDVQRRLDDHLDAIDRALASAGNSRSERRSITDEVEAQIREMLADRSATPASPTLAELEALLAELDPPEAYASEHEPASQPPTSPPAAARGEEFQHRPHPTRLSPLLIAGAASAAGGLLLLTPVGYLLTEYLFYGSPIMAGIFLYMIPWVATIVLGLLAVDQIRRRPDRYHGMAAALVIMLLYPMLLFYGLLYALGDSLLRTLPAPFARQLEIIVFAAMVALAVLGTWHVIQRARQFAHAHSQRFTGANPMTTRQQVWPHPPAPAPPPARLSRTAALGALWAGLGLLIMPLLLGRYVHLYSVGYHTQFDLGPLSVLELVGLPFVLVVLAAPIGATVVGLLAISQIRHSRGQLYGMGLAVFAALLFPLLALTAVTIAVVMTLFQAVAAPTSPAFSIVILTIVAVLLNSWIIRRAWRAATRPPALTC